MSQWRERGRDGDYMDPASLDCKVCGKSIPNRAWVVDCSGEELVFCAPDCERLYHDYWLEKYGEHSGTGK